MGAEGLGGGDISAGLLLMGLLGELLEECNGENLLAALGWAALKPFSALLRPRGDGIFGEELEDILLRVRSSIGKYLGGNS